MLLCGVFRVVVPENLRELFYGTAYKTFPYRKAKAGTIGNKSDQTFPCKTKGGTELFRLKKRVIYPSMGKFLGVVRKLIFVWAKFVPKNELRRSGKPKYTMNAE
jgi:hypothetical protein